MGNKKKPPAVWIGGVRPHPTILIRITPTINPSISLGAGFAGMIKKPTAMPWANFF
jgi:hypothetical protein